MIRYFPEKKGINLLFHKNDIDLTAFQHACNKYGRDEVMKVVEDILIRQSSSSSSSSSSDSNAP
ncbi:MAG: hypothetical protein ACI90V_000978 [Bacillariaceae sp.]|jgi:hypothetical protein